MRYVSSKIGIGLAIYLLAANAAQIVLAVLLGMAAGAMGLREELVWQLNESTAFLWILTDISMYLIALPVFYIYIRKMMVCPAKPKKPLKRNEFFLITFGAVGIGYWLNILGSALNYGIAYLLGKDGESLNQMAELLSKTNPWITLFFVVLLGPTVEEYMFRGLVLERIRMYGDRTAVIFTAVMFGLYHGNLVQFLYATALGVFFGYLKVRTNDLRYCIGAHMLVNLTGSIVIPGLSYSRYAPLQILGILIMLALMVFGVWCFLKHRGRLVLENNDMPGESHPSLRKLYLNKGMVIFYLCILATFAAGLYSA